ncbi:MAG: sulfatase-like hydrolase/transferase [Polyangiaceae bacterium]
MTLKESVTRGLLSAVALILAESAVVLFLGRGALTSVWEVQNGLAGVLPVALPIAALLGALGGVALYAARWAHRPIPRAGLVLLSAIYVGLSVWSVGGGRHLAGPGIRGGFAVGMGVIAAGAAHLLGSRLSLVLARTPHRVGWVALGLVINFELVNQRVLVRLYPGFHVSLAVLTCILAPFASLVLFGVTTTITSGGRASTRASGGADNSRGLSALSWGSWLFVIGMAACASFAARALSSFDNFRLLLVDSAPLLGQAVRAAAVLAPPPPIRSSCLDASASVDCAGPAPNAARSFSLVGRDLLLVTVDALRADHVGAYGYSRKTTPNLDRLAANGVRFDRAYAPTAHTSYSVTSLMTGKYMRPLLLQGAGQDSDTWATYLQRYGVRTAAFYPPAVFFIDPARFESFSKSGLGFEYRKVEFLEGQARADQVGAYLRAQSAEQRLFVWVHLFAPHEPYEKRVGFDFGDRDVDRYDSEIAFADDALGKIIGEFRRLRPNSVVVVGADHGEEFGEHGGRYHGTTVYEEQVRIPLVVHAPDLFAPRVVAEPVQSIDLLPTVLAALYVPRPPRIRGRDLGGLLTGKQVPGPGLALAETEEQLLLAEGTLRLVCARQLGACKLFDLATDPGQTKDVSADFGERLEAMRRRERELSASHGQFEAQGLRAEGRGWPSAILRGVAGDADAADEIAGLLDDADVVIRRKAAELLFALRRQSTRDALALALGRDEDHEVKAWSALALTRLGNGAPLVYDLLGSDARNWQRLAALALAETGDKRGAARLIEWWRDEPARTYTQSRELLAALGRIQCRDAVVPLTRSLGDVRLRPAIAAALADIGDDVARGPLVQAFAGERYQSARAALAEALVRLKAREELARPLARFLGVPDPLPGGLGVAARSGILEHVGGPDSRGVARVQKQSSLGVNVRVIIPRSGNDSGFRALVRVSNPGDMDGELRLGLPAIVAGNPSSNRSQSGSINQEFSDGRFLSFAVPHGTKDAELYAAIPRQWPLRKGLSLDVRVLSTSSVRVEALALVPLADNPTSATPAVAPRGGRVWFGRGAESSARDRVIETKVARSFHCPPEAVV